MKQVMVWSTENLTERLASLGADLKADNVKEDISQLVGCLNMIDESDLRLSYKSFIDFNNRLDSEVVLPTRATPIQFSSGDLGVISGQNVLSCSTGSIRIDLGITVLVFVDRELKRIESVNSDDLWPFCKDRHSLYLTALGCYRNRYESFLVVCGKNIRVDSENEVVVNLFDLDHSLKSELRLSSTNFAPDEWRVKPKFYVSQANIDMVYKHLRNIWGSNPGPGQRLDILA